MVTKFDIRVGDLVRFRRPFVMPNDARADGRVIKITPFGVRVDIGKGLGVDYRDIDTVNGEVFSAA